MADGFQSREIDPQPITGKNDTASLIPLGTIVIPTDASPDGITPATGVGVRFLGVTGQDIPNTEYGRVIVFGVAPVLAGEVLTVGEPVTSNASGRAVGAVATNAILGIAKEAGADGVLVEVQLAGPGGQVI